MDKVITALEAGGGLLKTFGMFGAGRAARQAGKAQRAANERAAKRTVAVAQRESLEEKRKARLLASRALALAAAGGGGASDPSIVKLIADIEGEGAYRAGVALYRGQEDAAKLRYEGTLAEWSGQADQQTANLKGASALLETSGGLYAKYQREKNKRKEPDYG